MNYTELTGQESGIWIYRESNEAIICNWNHDIPTADRPVIFCGDLFWAHLDGTIDGNGWKKTATDVPLNDWLDDVYILYDANHDADDPEWSNMTGDVYENGESVILAPKGWN